MVKIVVIVLCSMVMSVCTVNVPSYIKVCKRLDPNLNECIENTIMHLRDKLKTGMPDFNIESLEPLILDEDLSLANSESFSAGTKNINIYKIPGFDELKVNMDIKKKTLELNVHFVDLKLEGDYDIAAKILVPIRANGPIQIDIKDVTAKLLLKFDTAKHKGHERLFFTSSSCKLTIPDYTSNFVPRPGQDQTFAEAINDVLNSSKQEILSSITASLERGVAKKIIDMANGLAKNFTYDQLLPNTE